LGCSQCETLRAAFSIPLFEDSEDSSAVQILRVSGNSKYKSFNARPLCYGLLMNLCLSSATSGDDTIKNSLVTAGAVKSCLDVIKCSVSLDIESRKLIEMQEGGVVASHLNISGIEVARSIGLLSRLCTVPSVVAEVYRESTYRLLCKAMARNVGIFSGPDEPLNISTGFKKAHLEKNWVVEERTNLIRTLSSNNTAPSSQCKKIASEEKLILAVLHVFPTPSFHGAEITPESVIIPPKQPANALLLGNAARCLMAFADDEEYAAILYGKSAAVGMERLINAMATCSDLRVRKNIAILLAKGAKYPGIRERLTYFRGMQMIIELNKAGSLN
jgi:hypothetical protein